MDSESELSTMSEHVGNILDLRRDPRTRAVRYLSSRPERGNHSLGPRLAENQNLALLAESIESKSRAAGASRLSDISQRLAKDSVQETEYVRGVGLQLVRTVSPTDDDSGTRERPRDRSFPFTWYSCGTEKYGPGVLSWIESYDHFQVSCHNKATGSDTNPAIRVNILAKKISTIFYNIETARFLLAPSKKVRDIEPVEPGHSFTLPNSSAPIYAFRALLQQRFISTCVHMVPMCVILNEESKLKATVPREYMPSPPECVQPSLHSAQETSRDKSRATTTIAAPEMSEGVAQLADTITTTEGENGVPSNKSRQGHEEIGVCLRYKYGEIVEVDQLVLRLREQGSIEGGKDQYDRMDVYDGPFRVAELPLYQSSPKELFDRNVNDIDNMGSASRSSDSKEYSKDKLVKLDIPTTSKCEPWTQIRRLRPVFDIIERANTSVDARGLFQTSIGKAPAQVGGMADCAEILSDLKVARLAHNEYVTCPYISNEGLEDDVFEVDKLRGRKVDRCLEKDFPDEPQDDAAISECRRRGVKVAKGEILVVKYLVHWAGWPSEDDTWERGFGNIPQTLMNNYNAVNKYNSTKAQGVRQSSRK